MKQRFKKLLAVVLSAAMCIPALPAESIKAVGNDGVTFLDPESVSISELGSERIALFNEDWKFILDDLDGAESVNYNDAQWDSVNLPHDYSIIQEFTSSGEAESGYMPGGTGWYRKTFTLPASCENKTIVLDFDGVYRDAYVYVNGEFLGENHYGYTPFAFDITDYLECDGSTENVIAVKVEHQIPSSRWYSGSGIYRDVNLIITDKVHVSVDGTEVTTPEIASSEGTDGTVNVKVNITNDGDSPVSVSVKNTVIDSNGTAVAESSGDTVEIPAQSTADATDTAAVDEPQLWTIWSKGEQNLYTVHTELSVNGSVVDEYDSTLGFRWFEFTEEGFILNGEHVKLNGVCMHHDQGALGSAAYYDAIYRQLTIMKEMGVNAIRITHNPANRQYLEICNELGLLAIEEFFDGWNVRKNGNTYDFTDYFTRNMTEDNQILGGDSSLTWPEFVLKNTVRRDRNNPCLILWSLGNELADAGFSDLYPKLAVKLINSMKQEDSCRQATIGVNQVGSGDFPDSIEGVINAVIESGGIPGFNYGAASDILRLANKYGKIIASETASSVNSRGRYMGDGNTANVDGKYHLTSYDTSTVSWGRTAQNSMWATLPYDHIAGEFVWTGFDYIGEPTPWNGTGSGDGGRGLIPNSSYFGRVDTTGFEKDTYYLYRSQWKQDDTTLHLVTSWDSNNMIVRSGKTPVVVYSNAPVVKLYRNDTLIGTARRDVQTTDAGHSYYTYTTESNNASVCTTTSGTDASSLYASFNVTYEEGTISAKAFEEDEITPIESVSGKSSVSTPGTVSKLNASVNKEEIEADGYSLVYVTIDVTDEKDVLDTMATNEITFSLEGNGEIVGVDNGDQATTKKFQQPSALLSNKSAKIDAYAGKALAIVRSTKTGGGFTLKASADGLSEATVRVDTIAEDTQKNTITSYQMVKHFYAPVGTTDVTLPTDVKAFYTDGSTNSYNITWETYDKSKLAKPGTFKIDGSFNDGNETFRVNMTGHVYNPLQTAKTFSGITRPGVIPVLPTVLMMYSEDGEPFETFPVTWNTEGLTGDDFKETGKTISIQGTVNAFDVNYPATANIRVAEPVIDSRKNVAVLASHVTEDQRYSDYLEAVNDGTQVDNGNSNSRWSTYNQKDVTESTLTFSVSTQMSTDMIDIYYFLITNEKHDDYDSSQLPTSVRFQYAESCRWENEEITSDRWQDIDYTEVTDIDGFDNTSVTTGKRYALEKTVMFEAIRVIFGSDEDKFIGVNEIEILNPTESFYANTSADLDGISIGDVKVDFDEEETEYVISAPSFDNIEIANALNTAVTMLKVSETEMKLIAVSEDGKTTKTYTVILNKPAPPSENENTENSEDQKDQLQKGQKATIDGISYEVLDPVNSTVILTACDKSKKGKLTVDKVKIGTTTCTVVSIANNAFKKVNKLTSITIGDSVTSIGKNAFANCKKLKTVIFGKQVKSIQAKAFSGCSVLKSVKFKGTILPKFGKNAFKNTKSQIKVTATKKLKKNNKFKKNLTKAGMKSPKI